jgi:hypothetical protein
MQSYTMKTLPTLALFFGVTLAVNAQEPTALPQLPKGTEPLMLDIARFYTSPFISPTKTNLHFAPLCGQMVVDGLPFHIEGEAILFGNELTQKECYPKWERMAE